MTDFDLMRLSISLGFFNLVLMGLSIVMSLSGVIRALDRIAYAIRSKGAVD